MPNDHDPIAGGDPAGADRVTPLERRSRWLLRAYPAEYRRDRADEMLGTLLETSPAGLAWPRLRDVRALATGGLKARAAQNRHRTTAANLRIAVMVGVALFLSMWVAQYLANVAGEIGPAPGWSAWPTALTGLLIAATVALAWTAPRVIAVSGALAAAAAVLYFAIVRAHLVGPGVTQIACLAGLVALVSRTGRPSRRWLWLVGVVAAVVLLSAIGPVSDFLSSFIGLAPGAVVLGIELGSILWIGVDARPAVAFITYFVVMLAQSDFGVMLAQSSGGNIGNAAFLSAQIPLLLISGAIGALAVWLLRRQSARGAAARAK